MIIADLARRAGSASRSLRALSRMLALPVIASASLALAQSADRPPASSPTEARLRADLGYLADDQRGGRGVGTQGIDDAARHIETRFRELNLKPISEANGYFQEFSIRGEARPSTPTNLSFRLKNGEAIEAELGKTFNPLAIGIAGKAESVPLVFAGFGITAKDEAEKLDYDDYDGIDVKDKAVLIIRRAPVGKDGSSPLSADPTRYPAFTTKAINAATHGVKLVLMVNDELSSKAEDKLLVYNATPSGGAVPYLMISRELADKLLTGSGAPSLSELEAKINETQKPASRPLDVTVSAEVTVATNPIQARNVIGILEGTGSLADETVVVGAHYDHLGDGGEGSLAMGSREIHNGADDNASGTTMVLELARRLAGRPAPLARRVVFILFSGEEKGLLGSRHYVNNPVFPLDRTVSMVNFDMVGRFDPSRGLIVYGAGSSEGWEPLVESLASSLDLKPKLSKGATGEFGQSDHYSFYQKNLPVLFFFTGTHPQYHRPADDTHLINFEGMSRIADLGEMIVLDLASRPRRPEFVKLEAPMQPSVGQVRGNGVYFGSRPAYGENVEGVKLEGVTEGSPAEKAGLRGGDVIVQFAGLKVTSIEAYMNAMTTRKPGDEVDVVVLRDGKEVTLKATLGTRPSARPEQ